MRRWTWLGNLQINGGGENTTFNEQQLLKLCPYQKSLLLCPWLTWPDSTTDKLSYNKQSTLLIINTYLYYNSNMFLGQLTFWLDNQCSTVFEYFWWLCMYIGKGITSICTCTRFQWWDMLATGSVDTEQSDPSSIIMGIDPFIRSMKLVKLTAASH